MSNSPEISFGLPEVYGVLTVSTAHLRLKTLNALAVESDENRLGLAVYEKTESHRNTKDCTGYYIYLNYLAKKLEENDPSFLADYDDLKALLRYAHRHYCDLLVIDNKTKPCWPLGRYDYNSEACKPESMPSFTHIIDLSTAHLTKETLERLDKNTIPFPGIRSYPKFGSGETFGYFVDFRNGSSDIPLYSQYDNTNQPILEDIMRCIELAMKLGAGMICFDYDVPFAGGLPILNPDCN